MPSAPTIFLRLGNEVRGPFGRERLRELAASNVVTPATEAAETAGGPWIRLQELPEWTDIFPTRAHYRFKARQFVPVNRSDAPPVDHREMIGAAQRNDGVAPAAGPATPPPPNEIETILQQNRARQQQAGLDRLRAMPRAKYRRLRDYLIVVIGGNLVIFLSLNAFAGPAIGVMLAAFFTAGITWVMYGVMDRY